MDNIPLERTPRTEDYDDVLSLAHQDCECTRAMRSDLKHGDETICRPCAARQVMNGLTSLADEDK